MSAGAAHQRLARPQCGTRETRQIDLAVRRLEAVPHKLRVAYAVVTADMLFNLTVIAEQAVGERFLRGEPDGIAASSSDYYGIDRVADERRLQRRGAAAPERSEICQNLVREERLLT